MSETWAETLQEAVRAIVFCGSIGFLAWIGVDCFLKIARWRREDKKE